MDTEQFCPICRKPVNASPRYPDFVCAACLFDGVEIEGKLHPLASLDIHTANKVECSVKGVDCIATEAQFGGIVVRPVSCL